MAARTAGTDRNEKITSLSTGGLKTQEELKTKEDPLWKAKYSVKAELIMFSTDFFNKIIKCILVSLLFLKTHYVAECPLSH